MIYRGGFSDMWGEMRGKLSVSPSEALEYFGFRMKEGAIGICFQVRRGKQVIVNLMPTCNPRTPSQLMHRRKFGVLSSLAYKYLRDIVESFWSPLDRDMGGARKFISTNSRRLGKPPDWLNLTVFPDFGNSLSTPSVEDVVYSSSVVRFRLSGDLSGLSCGVFELSRVRFSRVGLSSFRSLGEGYFSISLGHRLTSPLIVYF